MSMVYGFIRKQSGGFIEIDSKVGRGTAMRLYLPRSEIVEEEAAGVKDGRQEPITGKGTVLVVEDDINVRELICDVALPSLGYTCHGEVDGPAALAYLERTGPVDLMLIDIILPKGINGIELAQRVKETGHATRVIFMTGYSDDEAEAKGLIKKDAVVLHKPFRIKELAQVVAEAFKGEEN